MRTPTCALGVLRMYSNRAAQGIAECERALAINRNLAAAHAWMGMAKVFAGRNEETEGHVLEALRISPRDARAYAWTQIAGAAKLAAGRDEEAVAWLNRSIELGPNWPTPHFWLAAALARLGRLEEACEAARAGLELESGLHNRAAPILGVQRQSRLSRAASACTTACARPGCRRNERDPQARRDSGVDVVGYSRLAGRTKIASSPGFGRCAAICSIPPSPCTVAGTSNALATG